MQRDAALGGGGYARAGLIIGYIGLTLIILYFVALGLGLSKLVQASGTMR